jgi:alkylation response protein AidB-like acyl-CoA dehydrogenase
VQAETSKGIALDFELTQEQTMILDTVRKAVKGQLDRARIRELDDREEFPEDVWRSLAEMGVLASTIPEEYGGMGAPYITNVLILEELARAFSPLGLGFLVFSLLSPTVLQHAASEELKREILPQVARGMKIAFAITEPQGGTDILAMRMRAELKGDQYVLNGQKLFITGADIAEKILTIARTSQNKERKSDGLSMFLV